MLVFVQTLGQPILVEQKRDFKMTDQERLLLNEIKEDTLSLIMADSSQSSVGHNIAKIVMEWEPSWC